MEYRNNFDFDLLITCRSLNQVQIVIKTIKYDQWERSYEGFVRNEIILKDELYSFILPKNCWIEDVEFLNVISVVPIK